MYVYSFIDFSMFSFVLVRSYIQASVPEIVRTCPSDGADLAGPLARELLRLSNVFNMDLYDRLREDALVAVMANYPAEAVPVATWVVLGAPRAEHDFNGNFNGNFNMGSCFVNCGPRGNG
jgi:hypothetical protein